MKVLWLSNVDLQNNNPVSSGTWILSMYQALVKYTDVQICANITWTFNDSPDVSKSNTITQYYVPSCYTNKNSTPSVKALKFIKQAILDEKPDLIHIWGTELYWGLVYSDPDIHKIPALLEIQGLSFMVGAGYYGGLETRQVRNMRGLMEFVFPRAKLENQKKRFLQWGQTEKSILRSFQHINTQSEWIRNLLSWYAPMATLYNTEIILRNSFLDSECWSVVHKKNACPVIFTTSSSAPYKGFHYSLMAFSLIRKVHPEARLRVAGMGYHNVKWKNGGYKCYLMTLCEKLDIKNNVDFLGSLNEDSLLKEMYNADVFLTSTYIESYCLALAEALAVGMPCVAPYTSAIPGLISNGENGILYPPADYHCCASEVIKLLENAQYAKTMGDVAAKRQRERSNSEKVARTQELTYKKIIESYTGLKV